MRKRGVHVRHVDNSRIGELSLGNRGYFWQSGISMGIGDLLGCNYGSSAFLGPCYPLPIDMFCNWASTRLIHDHYTFGSGQKRLYLLMTYSARDLWDSIRLEIFSVKSQVEKRQTCVSLFLAG